MRVEYANAEGTCTADGVIPSSFPLYVPGSPAFLPTSSEGESAESDGVCLRCHRCRRSDGTTAGVGEDF